MNVLWDFRLFSLGYGKRGVGTYTRAVADAFTELGCPVNLFILGDKDCIPESPGLKNANLIQYNCSNWKQDLIKIPAILKRCKIDIFHYWIALGPLWQIGIGLYHPCRTVATIYDLGVENWDFPFLKSVKRSWYWKTQKKLIRSINKVICISEASSSEFQTMFTTFQNNTEVIYKPIGSAETKEEIITKEKYFVTLGGSPHKNLARVIKAFDIFRRSTPDYKLLILGWVNKKEEGLQSVPPDVVFENSMDKYEEHLKKSAGLIFCSLYEGLGIPPIEGMSCGCPLLLSDIAPLHESCDGAAVFVDPYDVQMIAEGMMQLAHNNRLWSLSSSQGASRYQVKTMNTGRKLFEIYVNSWEKK